MLQGLALFVHVANKNRLEYDSFKQILFPENIKQMKLEHLVQACNCTLISL